MHIKDPYCSVKIRTGEWSVMFRYMTGKKLQWKHTCGGSSEKDAKLIVKLLNKEWESKHDEQ